MRVILEGENILKNEPQDSLLLVENVSQLADNFILLYKKYADAIVEDAREMSGQGTADDDERIRIGGELVK